MTILNKTFEHFGLMLDSIKTNYSTISKNLPYPQSISSVNDEKIENVKCFRYLCDEIPHEECSKGDTEIALRISLSEAKFAQLKDKICNQNINLLRK